MSRSKENISERLARAKARLIFNKYKDEEERTSFLKSRYNFAVKLSAVVYILFASLIILDLFLPAHVVEDKISFVKKTTTSSISRYGGSSSDTFWELNFENSRDMEMYYSKYFHNPIPGDEVKIEFSCLLNQPKTVFLVKWDEKSTVVSSIFSGERVVIYSIALVISFIFLILSKKGHRRLADVTIGFIWVAMTFILLTLFTK